eukprot:5530937-Amphidinium_carterae.1
MNGEQGSWTDKMSVLKAGGWCTNCKSLHDHLKTTANGSLQEKRVLLDIADICQCVDEGKVDISWIPTKCMLAGCLTKYLAQPQTLFLHLEFNVFGVDGAELEGDGMQDLLKFVPTPTSSFFHSEESECVHTGHSCD